MVMLDKDQIYELRIALGLTAAAFGLKVGVTANTVFRWESDPESSGTKYPSRRHQAILIKMWRDAQNRGLVRSLQWA